MRKLDIDQKYSNKFNLTYLVWIMLWVNWIKNSSLLIDWPNCVFFKSDIIFWNHDLFSDLKDTLNWHKLFFTWITVNNVISWHEAIVTRKIEEVFLNKNTEIAFLVPMPMSNVLGIQYDSLISPDKKISFIKWSINKDWIDWYENLLTAIVDFIDFSKKNVKKWTVSIVWHLFDRHEWDNYGNIEEIKRLLKWIWLTVNTIWLNWEWIDDLSQIVNSEYIISFPYARKTAKIIAEKLDIPLIETEIPFSIESTITFLRNIAEKTNKTNISEKFIKNELLIIKNKITPLIRTYFFNKNIIFWWEISYIPWIINFSKLFGFNLIQIFWMWNEDKEKLIQKDIFKKYNIKLNTSFWVKIWKADLIIKNSIFNSWTNKFLELSFPSINTHYLNNYPFFWFKWALNFIQNIMNK